MDHTNNSCCCGEAEHFSGCLICGAPITYRAESSIQTCSICHKEQLTNAVCENSHFICDLYICMDQSIMQLFRAFF